MPGTSLSLCLPLKIITLTFNHKNPLTGQTRLPTESTGPSAGRSQQFNCLPLQATVSLSLSLSAHGTPPLPVSPSPSCLPQVAGIWPLFSPCHDLKPSVLTGLPASTLALHKCDVQTTSNMNGPGPDSLNLGLAPSLWQCPCPTAHSSP